MSECASCLDVATATNLGIDLHARQFDVGTLVGEQAARRVGADTERETDLVGRRAVAHEVDQELAVLVEEVDASARDQGRLP